MAEVRLKAKIQFLAFYLKIKVKAEVVIASALTLISENCLSIKFKRLPFRLVFS
jgi:hypothetical protein